MSIPLSSRKPPAQVRFNVGEITEDKEDSNALFRLLAKDFECGEYPRSSIERQKTIVYSKLILMKPNLDQVDCVQDLNFQTATLTQLFFPTLSRFKVKQARMSL